MHTLVSFLGAARLDPKTGYRRARYRFPDGSEEETPFFSLALALRLAPERLLIFGTAGSMWPVLLEHGAGAGAEEARLALIESAEQRAVTQAQLDAVAEHARATLGRDVALRLIPYARQASEQLEILQRIADEVGRSEVSFDLTHGFRHLGMLGFLSAFMLERIGRLKVRGLWYGALDMTEGDVTPVVRLDGLLAIQRWIDALDRFDASGDYGVFAPLLVDDGVPQDKARCLQEASFFETTLNLPDARRSLQTFLPALDVPLAGASSLFRERLRERLAWARDNSLAEHQRLLALRALRRGDFLRAAVFGLEAFVTLRCLEAGCDPLDYKLRQQEEDRFGTEARDREHADWKVQAFRTLKNLRNAMAHGIPPQQERYRALLRNRAELSKEIEGCLNRLTNS